MERSGLAASGGVGRVGRMKTLLLVVALVLFALAALIRLVGRDDVPALVPAGLAFLTGALLVDLV
jgi:hypothetical protein